MIEGKRLGTNKWGKRPGAGRLGGGGVGAGGSQNNWGQTAGASEGGGGGADHRSGKQITVLAEPSQRALLPYLTKIETEHPV